MAGEIKTLEFSEGVSVSSPFDAGSGSGTGEVNFVSNNNGAQDLDQSQTDDVGDWIDSGTGTTSSITTSSGEIPRFPFQETAIKFTNDGSGTAYTQIRFRVPPADRNKKLKVEWAQKPDGSIYASGDFQVELYNYSDNYSTGETQVSFHGSADVPNQTGTYYNEFDSDNREYYELRIVRAAGSASGFIAINDFVVGPGKLHSGAVVTAWDLDWAVTLADFGNTAGLSDFTLDEAGYRRVGDSYDVFVGGSVVGTGTDAGDFQLPIPNGHTGTGSSTAVIGNGFAVLADGTKQDISIINASGFPVIRIDDNGATAITSVNGDNMGDTTASDIETFYARYTITASEISGSGVLNTIVQDNLTELTQFNSVSNLTTNLEVDSGYWRRVGDSIHVQASLEFSDENTDGVVIPVVPNSLTPDETKMSGLATSTTDQISIGSWTLRDAGANFYTGTVVYDLTSNSITLQYSGVSTSVSTSGSTPITFADGDTISWQYFLPITEWAGSQSSLVGFSQASATQAGLLPRYEEGSWTPVLKEGSNTMTVGGGATGYYQRTGQWVKVSFLIQNVTATTNGGNLTVEGLPAHFTAAQRSFGTLAPQAVASAAQEFPLLRIEGASAVLDLLHTTSTANHAFYTDNDLSGSNDDFYGQITYKIED